MTGDDKASKQSAYFLVAAVITEKIICTSDCAGLSIESSGVEWSRCRRNGTSLQLRSEQNLVNKTKTLKTLPCFLCANTALIAEYSS